MTKPAHTRLIDWLMARPFLIAPIALIVFTLLSYFMATIGEPQSFWLWHDILGIL